jgi:hypothetical protein
MSTLSGTGTRAATGATTTAGALLATIRPGLGDGSSAVWPDAELLGYLNEAVREYSQHARRISEVTLATAPGERRYALPGDLLHIISIEYPAGGQPRTYIHRLARTNRRFENGRLYDLLPSYGAQPPVLFLSFDPAPGTTLLITYSHPHDAALTLGSAVTVPYEHLHILLHYVLYAAARRLQQQEQAAPTSSSSLLMSQLASNTRRLELTYLNALNRMLANQRGEGAMVTWR